jgi:hypothetical protein
MEGHNNSCFLDSKHKDKTRVKVEASSQIEIWIVCELSGPVVATSAGAQQRGRKRSRRVRE